jgi:hypothetical protein
MRLEIEEPVAFQTASGEAPGSFDFLHLILARRLLVVANEIVPGGNEDVQDFNGWSGCHRSNSH